MVNEKIKMQNEIQILKKTAAGSWLLAFGNRKRTYRYNCERIEGDIRISLTAIAVSGEHDMGVHLS